MEIEELKELIDSTINENGERAITGKALNLVLNELVSLVSTSKPQTAERIYVNLIDKSSLTEAEKASNAALYQKLKTAFENDELLPTVVFQTSVKGVLPDDYPPYTSVPINVVYMGSDDDPKYAGKIMLSCEFVPVLSELILLEDGTFEEAIEA